MSRLQNYGTRVVGTALLLTLATAGLCQDTTEQDSPPAQDESIDEVTVYGTQSLHNLRIELHGAEEKVFAMFNELNLDDAYDIHCEDEIPFGSLTKRRLCVPNFLREASTNNDRYSWMPHVGGVVKSIPEMNKNLKKMMDALVAEQPEFREAFIEYATAKERFEEKHREDE
jgi:hypothetical protein